MCHPPRIFPVLPKWRSCPGARGRLLPFQRPLPVATLPGHILSSKGIIICIFLFLVLKKHNFPECLNHPQKWAEMSNRRHRADPSRLLLSEQSGVRQQELLPGDWEKIVFLIFFQLPYFLLKQSVSMCVFEQVRCIVERCDDGSIAPVPEGQCCPSKRACPAQVLVLSDLMIKKQQMISRPLDVRCAGIFLGAKL